MRKLFVLTFAVLAACQAEHGPFTSAAESAAKAYAVPKEILFAISYDSTHLRMNPGAASADGGYGVMHLVEGKNLEHAAQLAGVSVEEAKTRLDANLAAGAALLRELRDARRAADTEGAVGSDEDIVSWFVELRAYAAQSGADSEEVRTIFAESIFETLDTGIDEVVDGERIWQFPVNVKPPTDFDSPYGTQPN